MSSKPRPNPTYRLARTARRAVQAVARLSFILLLFATSWRWFPGFPNDLFFRLNPLTGLATMLASRQWIPPLALGLLTLALTAATGRSWCGWLCPLGAMLDWTDPNKPAPRIRRSVGALRYVKYFTFFAILIAALLGGLWLIYLDPLTLLFRGIAGAILPAFGAAITALQTAAYQVRWLQPVVNWFSQTDLSVALGEQRLFWPNMTLLAALAGVFVANAVWPRFWCRTICPLGGMLALISPVAPVQHRVDEEACIACGRCAAICPTQAIDPHAGYAADVTECVECLDCAAICPTGAIAFGLPKRAEQHAQAPSPGVQPSRRAFFAALGAAGIGALLNRYLPTVIEAEEPPIGQVPLRPPGTDEARLRALCIRCGQCVKVCPTKVLQPQAAANGLWLPELTMRDAYCDYGCNLCGQACPTGAIPDLFIEDKRQQQIGAALIDRGRCLAWNDNLYCIVCEEMCPVPEKAIVIIDERPASDPDLPPVPLPQVRPHLCIGCGLCEHQCPVEGASAIQVFHHEPGQGGRRRRLQDESQ